MRLKCVGRSGPAGTRCVQLIEQMGHYNDPNSLELSGPHFHSQYASRHCTQPHCQLQHTTNNAPAIIKGDSICVWAYIAPIHVIVGNRMCPTHMSTSKVDLEEVGADVRH